MNQTPDSMLGRAARELVAELTLSPRLLGCDLDGVLDEPLSLGRRLGRTAFEVIAAVRELACAGRLRLLVLAVPGCAPLTWLVLAR
jgi:hypothetical protein